MSEAPMNKSPCLRLHHEAGTIKDGKEQGGDTMAPPPCLKVKKN